MKFLVTATDRDKIPGLPREVEINTLEELCALQKTAECEIILNGDQIEIYNDYRE